MRKGTSYPSLWNVPANPVFRRHAVALLRPWRVAVWVVVTQVVGGMVWAVCVLGYVRARGGGAWETGIGTPEFRELLDGSRQGAYLAGWLGVLVVQSLLLVLKGTFSVATGVAREASEGMIEAERLTPLPSVHKVIGQLLGLPVLELVLTAQLTVWAVVSAWCGGLPAGMMVKVYLLLGTSALMHHGLGLVAGTLIPQKILAGTLSQLLIVILHYVLPALSGFGVGMLSHLDAGTAIVHEVVGAVPAAAGMLAAGVGDGVVKFFGWEVGVAGYHWLMTVSVVAVLVRVLVRRWDDEESRLLGSAGTVVAAVWVLVTSVGELKPFFENGGFEGMAARVSLVTAAEGGGVAGFGAGWAAGFALVLGVLNLLYAVVLVPRPRERERLQGATGRVVCGLSAAAAVVWWGVVEGMFRGTKGMEGMTAGLGAGLRMVVAMAMPALVFHGLACRRGWGLALVVTAGVWVVPMMAALTGWLATGAWTGWPMWLGGMSGVLVPAFAGAGVTGGQMDEFRIVCEVSLVVHGMALVAMACGRRRR